MRDRLAQRLQDLKAEYESGHQMLAELDAKQAKLRETLLRISGAMQVLEEMLEPEPEDDMGGARFRVLVQPGLNMLPV